MNQEGNNIRSNNHVRAMIYTAENFMKSAAEFYKNNSPALSPAVRVILAILLNVAPQGAF